MASSKKSRKNDETESMPQLGPILGIILVVAVVALAAFALMLSSQIGDAQKKAIETEQSLAQANNRIASLEKDVQDAARYKQSWQKVSDELDEFQNRVLNGTKICTLGNGCKLRSPGAAYTCNDLGNAAPQGPHLCTCDVNCSVNWS